MGTLLLLFVGLPALELWLLIEVGRLIGTLETIALIVVTGIVGASMARQQGLRVLSEVQARVAAGDMPADSLVDGIMILVASALLVTPGVLTDAFGFLCLIPGFRALVKGEVVRRFEKAVEENRVHFHYTESSIPRSDHIGGFPFPGEFPGGQPPMKDVTPPRDDESSS
jgi:UPF0716 protein FxsA